MPRLFLLGYRKGLVLVLGLWSCSRYISFYGFAVATFHSTQFRPCRGAKLPPPSNVHDVNIVFTFHYLKCMVSMHILLLFHCLLWLLFHFPAGCGGLLTLCLCLSVCIGVPAISASCSNAKNQPTLIVFYNATFSRFTQCTVKALTYVCQKIWEQNKWQTEWTKSLVIPLAKKRSFRQYHDCNTINSICHPSKVIRASEKDRAHLNIS